MSRAACLRRLYSGPRPATSAVANPYRDELPELDCPGAAGLRRRNLEAYLEAVGRPRILLLGEAMGYRGARFSGIAFTSERQLAGPPGVRLPWAGSATRRTSRHPPLWTEPSGTIVWRALGGRAAGVLLWNAFPWHPYVRHSGRGGRLGVAASRLTNRTPTPKEVGRHLGVLSALLDWAQPDAIAAVGRVAGTALAKLGVPCSNLRHPARGGATLFTAQLGALLARPVP